MRKYAPDDFDCIILDEAHHSSANTYQKVMNYFTPKLWLGMTATPDKRDDDIDGKNIYQIFNYQMKTRQGSSEMELKDLLLTYCMK